MPIPWLSRISQNNRLIQIHRRPSLLITIHRIWRCFIDLQGTVCSRSPALVLRQMDDKAA